jgi:transposase
LHKYSQNNLTYNTKDARTIALLVRDGRYSFPNIPKGSYANLRNYVSYRERLLKTSSQLTNRLHRAIDIMFPEYTKAFKDITAKTSLHTLKSFPTPASISKLSSEEIVQEWRNVVKSGIGKKKANQLKKLAESSVGLIEGSISLSFEMKSLANQLSSIHEQLDELDNLVEVELKNISYSQMFLDIKGLSTTSVSSIIAEIGDLNLYANGNQLKRLAGYNLRENSSGKHEGETTITKRGRKRLRRVLYNAVFALITQNEAFKQLYNYYRYRKDNPLKFKQAMVALSCKLLRILHGICKTNTKFDPKEVLRGHYINGSISQAA